MLNRILLSLAAISVLSQASAVTITHNILSAYNRTNGIEVGDHFNAKTIPNTATLDATSSSKAYWSRTNVAYTSSGNQVTFSYTFDQKRGGWKSGFKADSSQSYQGLMGFTVDKLTTYELSGWYTVKDNSGNPGQVYFEAALRDWTNPAKQETLVISRQESKDQLNEEFTLGKMEGTSSKQFEGALKGEGKLLVGRKYSFSHNAFIKADPDADSGASATGNVTLKLTSVDETGEPSVPDSGATAALMGLALLGLAAIRRRLTS